VKKRGGVCSTLAFKTAVRTKRGGFENCSLKGSFIKEKERTGGGTEKEDVRHDPIALAPFTFQVSLQGEKPRKKTGQGQAYLEGGGGRETRKITR